MGAGRFFSLIPAAAAGMFFLKRNRIDPRGQHGGGELH